MIYLLRTQKDYKKELNQAETRILIKLNQIGSVSETLEAIKMAHKAGLHRSIFSSFR